MLMNKSIEDYSFRYSGVMKDAMKSLPLGNGDIGVNVWLSPDGNLHLLLGKSDSWSELYRLLKPAHVVLNMTPCPFENGADFNLSIADGTLIVSAGTTWLRVYADAFAPCIRIALKTDQEVNVRLDLVNYRNDPIDPGYDESNYFMRGGKSDITESADEVLITPRGGFAQIHRNAESCYEFSLHNQDMGFYIGQERDPLKGLTFGAALYSSDMVFDGNGLLGKNLTEMKASIYLETKFTEQVSELCDSLDSLYDCYGDEREDGYEKHAKSWREFWESAYIYVEGDDSAEQVTRGFLYQRYISRCADRGNVPMKFNGLFFTADQMNGRPGNYDARRWGAPYWIQNTRIIYWYLLHMGDYESMLPMFDMYLNMMPIATARCKHYFGHAGMLIPETASFFGLYANVNYGFKNERGIRELADGSVVTPGEPVNHCIRYHYNGMLELSLMMLRYLAVSGDNSRRSKMFAFIEQALLFFYHHFQHVNGKLVITPVSALETCHLCVNDAPDVAGLQAVCKALTELTNLPESLKTLLKDMMPLIPELPMKDSDEGTILAPCEIELERAYVAENPELYSIFPYALYGMQKPGLKTARLTYQKRTARLDGGWSMDPVDAALLGLADEAANHLISRTGMTDKRALFPAFWGPNCDDTPDQDHGNVIALCLIFMLIQRDGEDYIPFPAWPEKWNVRFRIRVNRDTYICGKQINGKREIYKEYVKADNGAN